MFSAAAWRETGSFGRRFHPALPVPDARYDGGVRGLEVAKLVVELARNPIAVLGLRSVTEAYAHVPVGSRDSYVISGPELIRELFVTQRDALRFNPVRQALLRPILRDSLISAEGEVWRRARHAANPLFTPRAVARFASGMRDTARTWIAAQDAGGIEGDGWTSELTYRVLADALFSGELAGAEAAVEDIAAVLEGMGRPDPADLLRLPGWVPRLTRLRGRKVLGEFRAGVRATVVERRQMGAAGPKDLLGLLIGASAEDGSGLSEVELEDNVLGFIGAGHETTARWLSWWLYLLARDADAQARAAEEAVKVDPGSDPNGWREACAFLFATLEEALRLYPSVAFLSRIADRDIVARRAGTAGDLHIAKGSDVLVNLMALHRHRALWEAPDAFVPERMLGDAREAIPRFAYLPFGTGERVCIGARFAQLEAVVMAVLILRRFRVRYRGAEDPRPVMKVTLAADNAMPLELTRR